LKEPFRPDDKAVRYGGDEFLVIARGLDAGPRKRASATSPSASSEMPVDLRPPSAYELELAERRRGAADRRSEHMGEEPVPLIDLDCAGPCVRAIIHCHS
jgi:GGDEF domain-containing protein